MAYLKISEGCDHVCSFCAIPGFRGKFRSRPVRDLVAESRRLANQGVRELVLVSQDTMAYGKDLGMEDGITSLLQQLAGIDELHWVRFLYCYPHTITEDLIRLVPKKKSSASISTFRISMPAVRCSIACCAEGVVSPMSARSSASANSTRMPDSHFVYRRVSG
jgi:hypothetical protein